MAYVPETEENKQNNAAATPQIGTGSALPTTGGGGGAAPTGTMAAQPAAQSAGQGFANINQYLGANQGQGAATAGTVASNLGNQYTALQGDINNAANQAGEAIKGGSTAYDPNLVSSALNNPSQFVANPDNLAAWQKQYNAAYTGPTSFETSAGYGTAANAANKAAQTAQLGTTGGGYTQLLNQIEKNPTAGRTALDKALIQSDPNAQNTIQGALTPFKGIQDYVSGKSAEIGQKASEAAKQAQEASQKTQEATQGAVTNFNTDLTNKLQTASQARATGNKNVEALNQKVLSGQPLTSDELATLGVNADQYKHTQDLYNQLKQKYTTTPDQLYSPYFTPGTANPNAPSAETLASPEDFARESALEKLSGQQNTALQNELADKAGTYKDEGVAGKFDIGKKLSDTQHAYRIADMKQINPNWDVSKINIDNINDPKNKYQKVFLEKLVKDSEARPGSYAVEPYKSNAAAAKRLINNDY